MTQTSTSTTTGRGSRGWALVTGASSGLGAEFARERGHAVTPARHGIDAIVIEADLGVAGAAALFVRDLDARGITPEVLINNAGFGTHGLAVDLPLDRSTQMLQLNVTTLTELTVAVGSRMAARGSGAILNVASTSAFQPTPFFAVYGATKAYVTSFSQAMARELAPRGVRVTVLCPGPTRTEFFEVNDVTAAIPEPLVMSAERCVAAGLRGLESGQAVVIPGFLNALAAWFARVSPLWMVVRTSEWLMRPKARPQLPAARG
jgi:short-subunit dehydrogenase